MKVLFVVPPEVTYFGASAAEVADKGRECRPKLGIVMVASYLKSKNATVDIKLLDCPAEGYGFDEYIDSVRQWNPDVIAFTAVTFTIVDTLSAVRLAKEFNDSMITCIGGWHVSLFPHETLKQNSVDFVVVGEGEITFLELVNQLSKSKDDRKFDLIDGLGYKDSNGIRVNRARDPIKNLDELPFPDWRLLKFERYRHVLSESSVTLPLESSRGCPFKCTFCDQRGTKFRYKSAQRIVEEVIHYKSLGIRSIFFVDDQFIVINKRIIEFCKAIVDKKIDISFKISSRVDCVNAELLHWLKQAGCITISYGVESSSQKYRNYFEKGIDEEDIRNAFKLTNDAGVDPFAFMMIGIPGQTHQEIMNDLRFLKEIKAKFASFSVCSPYPKTELYLSLLKNGYYKRDYWLEFANNPSNDFVMPLCNDNFTSEELRKLQTLLTRKFHMTFRFLFETIKRMKNIGKLRNMAKLAIRILFAK